MNFSKILIRWYQKNKRDLPWRHTKNPYKIWLSEIILQQTRVQQGLPYYEKFVKTFPTIQSLANAKEGVILKNWQGLGYYSRARNLHFTAKLISKDLKGKFPTEFEEIKKLKGIGDYTASAIASFAFDKPHAVVDGNVFRVLSRYFGIKIPMDSSEGKREFTLLANKLIDKKDPSTFNQAIMEFGALQCLPQNPNCSICPFKKSCKALAKNLVSSLPIKSQKTKIRIRHFNYFVLRHNGKTILNKRTSEGIWKNMFDFPLLESEKELKKLAPGTKVISRSKLFKHILSHQTILARFWEVSGIPIKVLKLNGISHKNIIHLSDNQLNKYALPRLIERYFDAVLVKGT